MILTSDRADTPTQVSEGLANEPPMIAEARTGTLVGFVPTGEPLINIAGEPDQHAILGRSCVALRSSDIGRSLVLLFENGDRHRPLIVGVIQPPTVVGLAEVEIDGRVVVLKAEQSIVLQCGDASIALSRDGKIVIRGKHVVSHASGVNRIRGGSVELN